jgi:transcriptional regulator of arginine metabolism
MQQIKNKKTRLEAIKIIISSREIGNQEELLDELVKEGYKLTQATLSRDLKQLKVAKAASMNGNYVYVLPNNTMYKRMSEHISATEMMQQQGFVSLRFSGNLAVIKTRPGYASSMAYDIDNSNVPMLIGTVAGDDTIMLVLEEGYSRDIIHSALVKIFPGLH